MDVEISVGLKPPARRWTPERPHGVRVPVDRVLVETDSPYLAPPPHRGKRNEPAYIPHIVDRLTSLRQRSTDEMSTITTENAFRLFHRMQW